MTSKERVPDGTPQNTCAQRKRAGRPHRKHDGPFLDGTQVIIAHTEPLTGCSRGIVLCASGRVRYREWQTPTKYRVRIDGPGPTEERTIRGSLLVRVAIDG